MLETPSGFQFPCWVRGQGRFTLNKVSYTPKQASWLLSGKELDRSKVLVQKCNTPDCCQAEHLEEKTKEEANELAREKAREWHLNNPEEALPPVKSGQENGKAKLTDQQFFDARIMLETKSKKEVAKYFDISMSQVYRIAKGIRSEPKEVRERQPSRMKEFKGMTEILPSGEPDDSENQ